MDPLIPPRQWEWTALIPIAAGIHALRMIDGVVPALFAGIPGVLLLATGVALLLMRGDARVTAYMAVAGLVGVLFSLPLFVTEGFVPAVVFAALSIASFVVSGRIALLDEPTPPEIPAPSHDLRMQSKVAFDEAIMGYFLLRANVPTGDLSVRMCDEALELDRAIESNGWGDHPERLHAVPPAPEAVRSETATLWGHRYEHVSMDSGFVPKPELPGAVKWATHERNGRAHAWVFQHHGPARPWLVCIHGYRMGTPWMDLGLFRPSLLHHRFGLNVIIPILPLHGPRRVGRLSGDQYLDGDLNDLVFAQSQALWDLRRWIAWLRANDPAARIGVQGVSLGGYNTGLLSGYERDLAFALAIIPVTDFADAIWRVIPPPHRRYFASRGLDQARYRHILRCVSPMSRPPLVAHDRRFVVAANADRVVPVAQPLDLAKHWDVPVSWYAGSHLSIGQELEPRAALEEAMLRAGWSTAPPAV